MAVLRGPLPLHRLEVRLQGPWGSVIDVVGVGPANTIYVMEVKVSRSDFARDNHTDADLARLRKRADSLARRIELADAPSYRTSAGDLDRLLQEQERLRERLANRIHQVPRPAVFEYRRLSLHHGAPGRRAGRNAGRRMGSAGAGSARGRGSAHQAHTEERWHHVQRAAVGGAGQLNGYDAGARGTVRERRGCFPRPGDERFPAYVRGEQATNRTATAITEDKHGCHQD